MAGRFPQGDVPRVIILDDLEDLYLPVPFDHGGHADMAAMAGGCATCHHHTPEGAEHPACKSCHALDPAFGDIRKPGLKGAYHRQCMSCHREWSGETACGACHVPKSGSGGAWRRPLPTPGDLVGRMHPPIHEPDVEVYLTEREGESPTRVFFRHQGHIQDYGLRCAECHREDNCNRCHEAGRNHVQRVRSMEEHHQPCFSCHRMQTCEKCHRGLEESAPLPFDHSVTGWPLSAYHARAGCRSCHAVVPFQRRDTSCHSCHATWTPATFDHRVTGQALDETHAELDCALCHADRRFDQPPSCSDCHDEDSGIRFPDRRPGPLGVPAPP